jgi:tetratricopeptide (TPR) repeat protein
MSFVGGFFIANALNRSDLNALKKENERLSKEAVNSAKSNSELTLSDNEIKARIAEADENPENLRFNRDLGISLYRYATMKKDVGLLIESARIIGRVTTNDPKDYDALVALGNAHFDIANFSEKKDGFVKAREIYLRAAGLQPKDANVRTDIALTHFLVEPPELKLAINEFNRAIAEDPKNERALQFLIQAQWQNGDISAASATLEKLKAVNRSNPAIPELTTLMTRTPPSK